MSSLKLVPILNRVKYINHCNIKKLSNVPVLTPSRIISCSKNVFTGHNSATPVLWFSTSNVNMSPNPIVTYEEIKDLPNRPEKLLIDVRNPEELKENGFIAYSINIPRKSIKSFERLVKNITKQKFQFQKWKRRSLSQLVRILLHRNMEFQNHKRIGI